MPERAVSRSDGFHGDIKSMTIFGFIDCVGGSANHFNAKLFQNAFTRQIQVRS